MGVPLQHAFYNTAFHFPSCIIRTEWCQPLACPGFILRVAFVFQTSHFHLMNPALLSYRRTASRRIFYNLKHFRLGFLFLALHNGTNESKPGSQLASLNRRLDGAKMRIATATFPPASAPQTLLSSSHCCAVSHRLRSNDHTTSWASLMSLLLMPMVHPSPYYHHFGRYEKGYCHVARSLSQSIGDCHAGQLFTSVRVFTDND